MSDVNPEGRKLEEIADEMIHDMTWKTAKIANMDGPAYQKARGNNLLIIEHLKEIKRLQEDTMAGFAAVS